MKIKRAIIAVCTLCFALCGVIFAKTPTQRVGAPAVGFTPQQKVGVPAVGFTSPVARFKPQKKVVQPYGLKKIGTDSRTSSFNELLVGRAKRLCNTDSYQVFMSDGSDFIEFWSMANEVNLELEKVYTCLRLFYNHYKWCETIDYTVIDRVLKAMPRLFDRHFESTVNEQGEFAVIQSGVEDLMLDRFVTGFESFHATPDLFLGGLATDVTKLVKSRFALIQQENEAYEYREKLRNIIIRFSDMIVSRSYWPENDYRRIWSSFTSMGAYLHTMGIRGLINEQDNLDELWDTLLKRFVWYLDFRGSALPVEFYEQIEEDLNNHVVFFLEIDELDEGIKTKKEILSEAIIKAKAKAIAYETKGIITDNLLM